MGHICGWDAARKKAVVSGKAALLVDALEAVVAALFLDAGLELARDFVLTWVLNPELERRQGGAESLVSQDYKSELQERLHALGRAGPQYLLISEEGPDHKKLFTLEVVIADASGDVEFSARGRGMTKKRAGQDAAREALEKLNSMLPGSSAFGPDEVNPSRALELEVQ